MSGGALVGWQKVFAYTFVHWLHVTAISQPVILVTTSPRIAMTWLCLKVSMSGSAWPSAAVSLYLGIVGSGFVLLYVLSLPCLRAGDHTKVYTVVSVIFHSISLYNQYWCGIRQSFRSRDDQNCSLFVTTWRCVTSLPKFSWPIGTLSSTCLSYEFPYIDFCLIWWTDIHLIILLMAFL